MASFFYLPRSFHLLLMLLSDLIEESCFMPKKTKLLNIRIDAELKRVAKKIAIEDGRSLSNWVTRLIEKEVKKAEKEAL